MRVGLFPMVADVLHAGHISALREAKEQCDYLIVGLHCNPTYKTPVQSIYERYTQLDAVRYVDKVIPYTNRDDAELLIRTLEFDVYFLGEDYRGKKFECSEVLDELHKEIYYLHRGHSLSSTNVKDRIVQSKLNA